MLSFFFSFKYTLILHFKSIYFFFELNFFFNSVSYIFNHFVTFSEEKLLNISKFYKKNLNFLPNDVTQKCKQVSCLG